MVVVTLKFYWAQKQSHLTQAIKDRALIYNIERNMWIKCPVQWVAKFKHILHQNKAKQFYFLNQKELYFLSLLFSYLFIYLFLDSLFFFFVLARPAILLWGSSYYIDISINTLFLFIMTNILIFSCFNIKHLNIICSCKASHQIRMIRSIKFDRPRMYWPLKINNQLI